MSRPETPDRDAVEGTTETERHRASARPPGCKMRDARFRVRLRLNPRIRRGQGSFDAPSPRRAPRGCPLRQCWDPRQRSSPVTVLPTLSKTAPRRREVSSISHSRRLSDTRGAISRAGFPRVPPATILGLNESDESCRRGPKIVEDGTPAEGAVIGRPGDEGVAGACGAWG